MERTVYKSTTYKVRNSAIVSETQITMRFILSIKMHVLAFWTSTVRIHAQKDRFLIHWPSASASQKKHSPKSTPMASMRTARARLIGITLLKQMETETVVTPLTSMHPYTAISMDMWNVLVTVMVRKNLILYLRHHLSDTYSSMETMRYAARTS